MNEEAGNEVRVIESDSLWQNFRETCWRPPYIIGGVIAALTIAVAVTLLVVLTRGNSNDTPGELAIDYSKALIVSDERDLWALDLNSQEKTILVKTTQGVAAFDIYKRRTVYWNEAGSPWVNSLSSKFHNLTQSREWEPRAVAIDYITENVYVLDGLAGKLNVYEPASAKLGIVVSDLRNPSDIGLDPIRGVMFVVQHSHSIIKVNMDGKSLTKVISSPGVTSVAVDSQTPRLYWADSASIASSDYFGGDYRVVTAISGATLSLAVSGNRLFWTRPASSPGSFRSLWTTTVGETTGISEIDFQDPKMIKVYTGEGPSLKNPCGEAKGGCEQLCLLTTAGGKSCGCYVGFRLKEDGKACEKVEEFIVYAKGGFVRGRLLDSDKQAFSDVILPIRFQMTDLSDKRTVDFDYNVYTNTFAFSDDRSVSTVDLLRNDSQGAYSQVGDKCLKDVSFNWVTNDVYYIKDNCRTAENTAIVVLKPREDKSFRRTLRTFDFSAGQLRSLVVHPHRGIYFFTVLQNGEVQIYRARDSKIIPTFEAKLDANETGLALDYAENRLYWFSRNTSVLYNANLDGTDIKSIDVSMIREPRSVGIHERYAYVGNLTSIWRLDKLTGYGPVKLAPSFEDDTNEPIAGVKIFSRKVQVEDSSNPCAIQNGDCEQFCFLTPRVVANGPNSVNVTDDLKKTCLCEDYKSIRGDARTCA